jgi:hypothetical protein
MTRATVPVLFTIGPAEAGWMTLTIQAGEQVDHIRCSDVYDPWRAIIRWVSNMLSDLHGCVRIDEEGYATILWLDREPGSPTARLRVFEPGGLGEVETARIDALIDCRQMAVAFIRTFTETVKTYNAMEWGQDDSRYEDPEGNAILPAPEPIRTLAEIDMRWLRRFLTPVAGSATIAG